MSLLPPECGEQQIVAAARAPRGCERKRWVAPALRVVLIDEITEAEMNESEWDGVGFAS
ncbi:MAG: hypothetical protein HQL39_10365 [Alphaproteobacteria bacterium]|nr:hypothetical protein [Alphaproteobacteria bacterium]